jgi:hypothetical protein
VVTVWMLSPMYPAAEPAGPPSSKITGPRPVTNVRGQHA